jgi:hypothetical protein
VNVKLLDFHRISYRYVNVFLHHLRLKFLKYTQVSFLIYHLFLPSIPSY